jgi:Calpain family cysteine protease
VTRRQARTGSNASEELQEDAEEEYDEYDEYSGSNSGSGSSKVWCTEGRLFIGGSGSGDVIQGSLGDCWFLGALRCVCSKILPNWCVCTETAVPRLHCSALVHSVESCVVQLPR